MRNARAEEAFTEIELPQFRTTGSRREEDEFPLVRNSFSGSTLYGSHRKFCTSGWRKVWRIVVALVIALAIGLGVGLYKWEKHKREHPKGSYTGALNDFGAGFTGWDPEFGPEPDIGACGRSPGTFDVQISPSIFAAPSPGSNLSASCGRTIRALGVISHDLTVYDKCPECGPTDISVSDDVWYDLVNAVDRNATVTWYWLTSA